MRRDGHIPQQFSLKVEKFRKCIRQKQIEQYKRKIRKQLLQYNQINNPNWVRADQHHHEGLHNSKENLSNNIREKFLSMLNICHCIHSYQEKYKQLVSEQQKANENQNQCEKLKQIIVKYYKQLINQLISLEIECEGSLSQNEYEQFYESYHIIFKNISELSKVGVQVLQLEQQSSLSYLFQKYLISLLDSFKQYQQNGIIRDIIDWEAEAGRIQLIIMYVRNRMNKDIQRYNNHSYHHRNNQTHHFNITVLQQSILMKLLIGISQVLSKFSMWSLLKQYLFNMEKATIQGSMEKNNKPPKIISVINSITQLHTYYIKLYCNEIEHNLKIGNGIIQIQHQLQNYPTLQQLKSDQQIGNINLATFKEIIKIFAYFLMNFQQCLQDFQFLSNKTTEVVILQLSGLLCEQINICLDFLTQFNIILEVTPNQDIKILENQTSNDKHGTLFAIYCLISDSITNLTEYFQQIQEESYGKIQDQFKQQLSFNFLEKSHKAQKNKKLQKISEKFFDKIKNKQLVSSLYTLISRKLYTQQYINQIYEQSKLPIYIMACIFNCNLKQCSQISQLFISKQQSKNISYNKYRQSQSRIKLTATLELECLKIMYEFLNNYGIKIDIQDNLQIRYLTKIGDGTTNDFYFSNLSKQRRFIK